MFGELFHYFLLFAFVSCKVEKSLAQHPDVASYQNPVFNHDFPDPNLVKGSDGYFYAYSTQVNWSNDNFGTAYTTPILRSKNLVDWKFVGAALPIKPDWKTEGGIWAPDASFYNNKYYLYYSFSIWGDPNPVSVWLHLINPMGLLQTMVNYS